MARPKISEYSNEKLKLELDAYLNSLQIISSKFPSQINEIKDNIAKLPELYKEFHRHATRLYKIKREFENRQLL